MFRIIKYKCPPIDIIAAAEIAKTKVLYHLEYSDL